MFSFEYAEEEKGLLAPETPTKGEALMSKYRSRPPHALEEQPAGQPAKTEKPTVQAVIDRYLQYSRSNNLHAKETLAERERVLKDFAAKLGERLVVDCLPHHLEDWIEDHRRWKSSSTKRSKANQVNAAFNWAADGRRIGHNPFRGVNYEEAQPRPCMSEDDFGFFTRHCGKAFERAMRFLRLTGCRVGELCDLQWSDIDWERGLVILEHHKAWRKTRKAKTFALIPEALELLQDIKKHHYQDGHIFRNTRGTPWDRRTLGQTIYRLKQKYGVPITATLHGIRHQFATQALRNGGNLKMVSKQLGHGSVAVTEKYYLHLETETDGMRAAAAAAVTKKDDKKSSSTKG